ncbi:unnamed protein product [Sphagnum balticum]
MAMAVAPVSRLSSAHSVYISHTSMSSSNRYLNLAFSSSSKHASSQASLMTEYSFSSRRVVARSPQAAMATISQNAHRIAYTMATLKVQGKVALIPYLTAGDPDLDTTAEAMQVLDMCGCDIIELGVPYSDPLADGPVIQAAATRSLAQGTTLEKVLDMLKQVVPNLKAPVVLFTYYNPILKRGPEVFMKAVKAAGASGLVVPDLPLEETDKLREFTFANDLELILLTTPTTPQNRAKVIARASEGFVYLVSLTGVTGARESVHSQVQSLLKDLKQVTTKSVAVGFGISLPEHAYQVAEWGADGVIVGSAMVKLLGEAATPKEGLVSLEKFARELKAVLPK